VDGAAMIESLATIVICAVILLVMLSDWEDME
jgi:hypothetical protein